MALNLIAGIEVFQTQLVVAAQLHGTLQVGRRTFCLGGVVHEAGRCFLTGSRIRSIGRDVGVCVASRSRWVHPVADLEFRLAVVARERVNRQTTWEARVEAALQTTNVFGLLGVNKTEDVKTVFVQATSTKANVHATAFAAFFLRLVVANSDGAAGEVVLGDEVNHTADSVGTVQGRRAIAQNFDTLNRGQRNHVQVDGLTVNRIGGKAAAVQQNQSTVGTDTAHVCEGRTASAGADYLAGALLLLDHAQLAHHLFDRSDALLDQVVHLDNGDWYGAFGIDTLDGRTGHFNTLQRLRFLCKSRLHCQHGRGSAAGKQNRTSKYAALEFRSFLAHGFSKKN